MKWRKKARDFFAFLRKSLDNHPLIFIICLSLLENLMIESLSRHSLFKGLYHLITSPGIFIYNSAIIMLTLSLALFFKRRVFGIVLFTIPWLVCGIANCVILAIRITPLGAIDFQIMKISLILIYLEGWQRILLYCAVALFAIAMVTLWIAGPKVKEKIRYGRETLTIVCVGVAVAVMSFVMQGIFDVGSDFTDIAGAYEKYGFAYSFSSSIFDTGMDEPENYDKARIEEIMLQLPETNDASGALKPDIILIQMESFIDAKTIKGITFSDDPAPVHTYLRENYSTGKIEVPSFGGGTANTEFEILTGINLDKFGPGEYPYKTVLQEETCETIAYNLGEIGYSAHAIHNHTGDFYDRDIVYPRLGFDSFQSIEYMSGYETTPYGWCRDKALTKEIMTALTHTDKQHGVHEDTPRFIWTVSVQGHGAYPSAPIEGSTNVIDITGDRYEESDMCALEYYVNQAWEMDMFLGSLISVLETRERPTLLIAYGDHLPSLNLTEDDITTGNLFATEYVTWNNFGLKKTDRDLRTYELSAEIMGWLGFNNGNITKLHQYMSAENPPVTEEKYQNMMAILAYDMLYGENIQFNGKKPYKELSMRMGTLPVTVDSIKVMDGNLYVQGSGFTAESNIFINGEKVETMVLSEYSLVAKNVTVNNKDEIKTGQTDSQRDILSYSNSVIYDESIHKIKNQ